MVRTIDAIDSDKNQVGDKFLATLEQTLYVNNVLVAPRGADVYGRLEEVKAAGHIAGKSDLKLALTGIVIDGRTLRSPPVITNSLPNRVARIQPIKWVAARLPARSFGTIVGGGKSAAISAGVGAGAGTAVQVEGSASGGEPTKSRDRSVPPARL
jgi:hypothetical protein